MIHLMTDDLKNCESEIIDSLIKYTKNTDEARGILQKIEHELDSHSKVIKDEL